MYALNVALHKYTIIVLNLKNKLLIEKIVIQEQKKNHVYVCLNLKQLL